MEAGESGTSAWLQKQISLALMHFLFQALNTPSWFRPCALPTEKC